MTKIEARPQLVVSGPVETRSGYGNHTRDLVRSLLTMDKFDIKILATSWGSTPRDALNPVTDKEIIDRILLTPMLERKPEIFLQCSIPTEFQPFGIYNIGVTAGIETTACPPEWIHGMNRMDMNIVPSKFGKNMFETLVINEEANGKIVKKHRVIKPIEVLFEGADTSIYKKVNLPNTPLKNELLDIKETFVFLYVGHWLQGGLGRDRKDTGMMVKTFLETFKNNPKAPALLMKTSGAGFSILDREDILAKIEQLKRTVVGAKSLPNVYVLHGDLTDDEMNELYNQPKVKAHISFTHGEGYGRPLLEAVFSEKPVIAPNWSGQVDFLSPKYATLLPGAMTPVPSDGLQQGLVVDGAQWYTVNYNYASNLLKDVHKNYSKYKKNLKQFSNINKGRFSLDAMTRKFEKLLDENLPEFQKQVQLEIPRLKKKQSLPKMKVPIVNRKI